MNIESLNALKSFCEDKAIEYLFTFHNSYTGDVTLAFSHIDEILQWKKKGFVFGDTAPYDCFNEK